MSPSVNEREEPAPALENARCPFDGGVGKLAPVDGGWRMWCESCGAYGPKEHTTLGAIESWNDAGRSPAEVPPAFEKDSDAEDDFCREIALRLNDTKLNDDMVTVRQVREIVRAAVWRSAQQ